MRAESGALALATSIAQMSREQLLALVQHRHIASADTVREPLGLALELLRPDSVARALSTSHRDELLALLALQRGETEDSPEITRLIAVGLAGIDADSRTAVSLPEVASALAKVTLPEAADRGPSGDTSETPDTSAWYGQAITSVRRAASVLRTLSVRPVRLGRKGAVAVASLRELAETIRTDQEPVEHLVAVLRASKLLSNVTGHGGKQLLVSSFAADNWLQLDYSARWITLAQAAIRAFDSRARTALCDSAYDLDEAEHMLPFNFPLLPANDLHKFAQAAGTAEELGLSVGGHLTPVARALLTDDELLAETLVREHMPPPVKGVYLQPDLSLIAPGPLRPDDESVLSRIAITEQLGPAASLRLSSASLTKAVQRGFAPQDIRAHLERLSFTGIPQPLDYLLTELERQALGQGQPGSSTPYDGVATRPQQQFTRAVEQVSNAGAGYAGATGPGIETHEGDEDAAPHVDASGQVTHFEAKPEDPTRAMVERVFAAAHSNGHGDIERRLELAIRERRTLKVTAVAGSTEYVFTVLPVSLQGGRLRASDEKAGVVRTLPLGAITAIEF